MMQIQKVLSLLLLVGVLQAVSYAGALKAPFILETAKTLPSGIRNIRYNNIQTTPTEKFDGSGTVVPLGDALNTDVTFLKLVEGKDTPTEQAILLGYLRAKGYDLDEIVGQTTGEVNVSASVSVPVFAYGINERWTLAIAVPIIQSKVSAQTGFVANSQLEDFAKQLQLEGKEQDARTLRDNTYNATQTKLTKWGYEEIRNEEKTEVGDIKLVSKYKLLDKTNYILSLKNEVTLPTGKATPSNKALDVPSGDGQFDLGMGVVVDYLATDRLVITADGGLIAQLPHTAEKRVPERSDSSLTPDIDSSTKVDLGDQFYSNLTFKYQLIEGLTAHAIYGFQYKERDDYSGDLYDNYRYAWLGQDSEQRMHSARIGIGYSTLPLFRAKKFAVPLEAKINHTRVIDGKNVTKDPLTSLEMVMYF
jgi:hypothetical protein